VLSFVMLLTHWVTLVGHAPWPTQYIGIGWMIYALIGVIGTYIMGKKLDRNPNANALSNRVSSATWAMAGAAIFTFAIGCVLSVFLGGVPSWIFNAILPVSFICYGSAHGVIAKLAGDKTSGIAAVLSFGFALLMMPLLLTPALYLLTAFMMLAVTILPNVLPRKAS